MAPSPGGARYAVLREDGEAGDGDEEACVSVVHADDSDDTPVPFWDEARGQLHLALPVSLSMVCNRVMSLTSVAFVGHLGALPLAAAALATTLGNVTGNSIMVGMASASSTLGGQAFGAERYFLLGAILQRCLVLLTIAAVPISLSWINAESVLLRLGQDPEIATLSGVYMRCLIPGLFFYAWNISTQTYMQSQRITRPSAAAGVIAATLHVPVNYVFIHAFKWGYAGAGLATSWSNGVVLLVNVSYLRYFKEVSGDEKTKTWTGWSVKDAFSELTPFLRLAVPGVFMMAEWWASELNIILAGWLPDPRRNVAAVSIFQITNALAFMLPIGFSVAVCIRCSNELGSGNWKRARRASDVSLRVIWVVEFFISVAILAVKDFWARLYTDDARVVRLVSRLLLPLAVYTAFDGALCVASGAIKACGKQRIAGMVVFGAYYVVGIPLAYSLAFHWNQGAMGLAIALRLVR
jgi:MATE family multidrug resistance protein